MRLSGGGDFLMVLGPTWWGQRRLIDCFFRGRIFFSLRRVPRRLYDIVDFDCDLMVGSVTRSVQINLCIFDFVVYNFLFFFGFYFVLVCYYH